MSIMTALASLFLLLLTAVGVLSFIIYPFKFLGIKTRLRGLGVAIVSFGVFVVIALVYTAQNSTTPIKAGVAEVASVTQTTKEPTPDVSLPSQERDFVDAVQRAKTSFETGANDMARGAARPQRARALCGVVPEHYARDWIGKVSKLSSNSDGKGVLEIALAENVEVKTWNNEISDFADHTLIDPSSTLFAKASQLQVGQTVRFSGTFATSDVDCVKEASMTLAGSMASPEFILHFDEVSPHP